MLTIFARRAPLPALLLAALGTLAACSGGSAETNGTGGSSSRGTGGAGTGTSSSGTGSTTGSTGSSGTSTSSSGAGGSAPGTLASVQAIFDARCTGCHDASKHGVPAYPSLSLVAGDTHASLVGKAADEVCGGTRVVAGSPGTSYLMSKISPAAPCSGGHMPAPFEIGPSVPLTDGEVATIQAWIEGGALP